MAKKSLVFIFLIFINFVTFSLNDSASLLDVAINDYKKGQYSFAINNLTKYLQITESNQNKSQATYYLSLCYYFTDNYKMSLKNFNELINKYRSSSYASIAHFWIGLIYQNTGKWEEAGQSFEKYISLYPHSDIVDKAYFAYANCLLELNKFTEASQALKELVTKHRKSDKYEEGCVLYAYVLMKIGENETAKKFLTDWANKLGNTGGDYKYRDRFWLYLAEILISEENLIEANVFLKKIDTYCQDSPSNDIALLRLAYIANKLDNEKEAKQYITRLNTEFPNSKYNVDATLFLGLMSFDKDEFEDALVYFDMVTDTVNRKFESLVPVGYDETLRLMKLNDQAQYYIGDTYEKLGNYSKSYEVFCHIADDVNSSYAANSVLRVINLLSTKDELGLSTSQIYDYLCNHSQIVQRDPVLCNKFLLYKARYEAALQKYTECIETCDSIKEDKLLSTVAFIKSNALVNLGKPVDARVYLQECFDKVGYDDKVDIAFDIMNLFFNEGNYNQALRYYQIIFTYGKNNSKKDTSDLFVRTGYLCGLTYLQMKDNKRGIDILNSVINRSKSLNLTGSSRRMLNQSYYYLGWLYYREGDFDSAAKNFAISSKLDIGKDLVRDSFYMEAWSYFSNKDYQNAVTRFEKMYNAYGDDETGLLALYRSAKCYENLNKQDKALDIYSKIANTRRNNPYKAHCVYELVKNALSKRNFVEAETLLETLHKLDLDFFAQGLLLQAETYLSLERYSEAYSIYNYYLRECFSENKMDQNAKDSICYWAAFCASKNNDQMSTIELLSNIKKKSSFYPQALCLMIDVYRNNDNLTREKQFIEEALPYMEDQKIISDYKKRLNEIALVESGYSEEEADLTLKASSGDLQSKYDLAYFYIHNTNINDVKKGLDLMKSVADGDKTTIGAKANVAIGDVFLDNNKFDEAVKIYFKTASTYEADKSIISESLYKCAYCYYRLGKPKMFDSILAKLQEEFPNEEWTAKAMDLKSRVY